MEADDADFKPFDVGDDIAGDPTHGQSPLRTAHHLAVIRN
jgi:hypothetical protein